MGFGEFGEGNVQTEAEQELTDFSFSYFLSFLSLFSEKNATFCTKLIIDFGHHDRIDGKRFGWHIMGKKNTNKESHVTWNCPQCFLICRTVQTGSIMLKSKLPHKCLYKVLRSCTGRPATQVGILLRCICNWKEELFYFLIFVSSMLLFLFFYLAGGRVCASVTKCLIWRGGKCCKCQR